MPNPVSNQLPGIEMEQTTAAEQQAHAVAKLKWAASLPRMKDGRLNICSLQIRIFEGLNTDHSSDPHTAEAVNRFYRLTL